MKLARSRFRRGNAPQYWRRIKALFGSSLIAYYPDVYDGIDKSSIATIANPKNITQAAGITSGGSGFFNGVTSVLDIYSPEFAAEFNPNEFGIIASIKIDPLSGWTGATRDFVFLSNSTQTNRIYCQINNPYKIDCFRLAGGVSNNVYCTQAGGGFGDANWITIVFTGSVTDDNVIMYVDGIQRGIATGLGEWSGVISSTRTVIGAVNNNPSTTEFGGFMQNVAIVNRKITPSEAAQTNSLLIKKKRISVLGDSIVNNTIDWPYYFLNLYHGTILQHAVGGTNIVSHLASQVVEAASDDADIIFIGMGTNDSNVPSSQAAIQTAVSDALAALKVSNPRARIYYVNVFPRYDVRQYDVDNIRISVASACAAQNVTCWDTYTDPWINADDTSDNIHPNSAGALKIANQVLTRI